MTSSRVVRGRKTNRLVADWLRGHGWPDATATYGSEPGRDVKNVACHAIEVKARSDFNPLAWLRQAAKHITSDDERPCVVVRMNGQGEQSIGDYLVIRRLCDDELNRHRQWDSSDQ